MPPCCVVNAIILYAHPLDNSKHRSRANSRLSEGRKSHVLSCNIDYPDPLTGPCSRSPRNTQSSFLSAPQIAQEKNFQNTQTMAVEILEAWATSWCNEYQTTWFQFTTDKNQWILKRLQKQVEIKLNIRIAKKKTFSLFSHVSIIHGRTAVTFYQAILSGTSLQCSA